MGVGEASQDKALARPPSCSLLPGLASPLTALVALAIPHSPHSSNTAPGGSARGSRASCSTEGSEGGAGVAGAEGGGREEGEMADLEEQSGEQDGGRGLGDEELEVLRDGLQKRSAPSLPEQPGPSVPSVPSGSPHL